MALINPVLDGSRKWIVAHARRKQLKCGNWLYIDFGQCCSNKSMKQRTSKEGEECIVQLINRLRVNQYIIMLGEMLNLNCM